MLDEVIEYLKQLQLQVQVFISFCTAFWLNVSWYLCMVGVTSTFSLSIQIMLIVLKHSVISNISW